MNQILRRRSRPQSAVEQRLRPVTDHLRWIEIILTAQPVTLRARSIHTVKRKRPRLQLWHVDAAIRASQPFRIELLFSSNHRDLHQPARQFHGQPDRHFQTVLDPRLHQQPVNDDFNRVILPLVQINDGVIVQTHQLAIDARASVAMLDQRLHLFLEFAFAPADDRRHYHDTILGGERHHALDDLIRRLPADGPPALGTVRHSDGSEQQAKIVVDLGDRSYGRSRTPARSLLLNRY